MRSNKHSKYTKAASGGFTSWCLIYVALLIFTIGTIAVLRLLPAHGTTNKTKVLNILLTAGSTMADFPMEESPIPEDHQVIPKPSPPTTLMSADQQQQHQQQQRQEEDQPSSPRLSQIVKNSNTAITTPTSPQQHQQQHLVSSSLRGSPSQENLQKLMTNSQGAASLGMNTILLVIASNRPDYLKKALDYILRYHPRTAVPIIISQDGNHPTVNNVIDQFSRQFTQQSSSSLSVKHVHHQGHGRYENGYFALADHFKWALSQVFMDEKIERVIILEEDLQIAPDFFEYFAATASLLDQDDTLMAVSAWNDNGFEKAVKDPKQLYRSDFFPGLGWMMPRRIWKELESKWPRAYWDDWLREPKQRQGRQFIRPEVCRTLHYGQRGVSNAQYSDFLTAIHLNNDFIPFTTMDLSYLQQPTWDKVYMEEQVKKAPLITVEELPQVRSVRKFKEVRIEYDSLEGGSSHSFPRSAKQLGIMDNIKARVPRTAYKGIVSFWSEDVKVHLVPKELS
eukprot:gene5570-6133_t